MLITLDLDGVLMKNPFSTAVFPAITEKLGKQRGLSHREVMGLILKEVRVRAARGDYVAAYDWDDIVATVGNTLGFQEKIDVAELVQKNCTPEHIHSYPGVHETLARLKDLGHVLVALTNGFAKYQVPVLEALGLRQYLAAIYTPEVTGFAKPDAAFFAAVRRDFDLPHMHVGDTVAHDLWGAKQSGAWAVWVYHNLPQEIADLPLQERTAHPKLLAVIARALERDIMAAGYPEITPEDCLPHFVTADIGDVVEIAQLLEGSHQRGPMKNDRQDHGDQERQGYPRIEGH